MNSTIQNAIDQILNPKPRILYPYQGEIGKDLIPVEVVLAEEQHLGHFIADTRHQFEIILSEKYKFSHHLNEFFQKTLSRRFLFAPRVHYLREILHYLDLEEKIVQEYIEILDGHRQTLEQLYTNQANINFGFARMTEMPNMKTVQQIAHDVLDRMFSLHSILISQLVMPLDAMEMEFQHCIYSDLAGFNSWQQQQQLQGIQTMPPSYIVEVPLPSASATTVTTYSESYEEDTTNYSNDNDESGSA